MSGRNPTKRSEERRCERCGNPPPTWNKQMQRGERVQYLCRRCVHQAGQAKSAGLDYHALDVSRCDSCGLAIHNSQKRYADVSEDKKLRGVICEPCRNIIRACDGGHYKLILLGVMAYIHRMTIGNEEGGK